MKRSDTRFRLMKEGNVTTPGLHQQPIRDRIELTSTSVRIAALEIPIEAMVNYLRKIPSARRELALVHAIEVGITEILARRTRFDRRDDAAERQTVALLLHPTASQSALPRQLEAVDHLFKPAQPVGTQSCDEFLARLDESIQTAFTGPPRSAK
jgi:hypothetical protein